MTSPNGTGTKPLMGPQNFAVVTAFLALFSVVGVALYGLPIFYPYFVEELGWTRQQVTSGNAYSKIAIALLFGVLAGRFVDRFGPRRMMLVGIVMAGGALVGLASATGFTAFYLFYAFNAMGYVFGGPLPNQVLLSRWFDKARGRAMGIAYLGIGVGGALVPQLAYQFGFCLPDLGGQLDALADDHVVVIVCELAPVCFDMVLELLPVAFDDMRVHINSFYPGPDRHNCRSSIRCRDRSPSTLPWRNDRLQPGRVATARAQFMKNLDAMQGCSNC